LLLLVIAARGVLGGFELRLEVFEFRLAVCGEEGVVFVGFFGISGEEGTGVEGCGVEAWIA
jgi:hypothetical protein